MRVGAIVASAEAPFQCLCEQRRVLGEGCDGWKVKIAPIELQVSATHDMWKSLWQLSPFIPGALTALVERSRGRLEERPGTSPRLHPAGPPAAQRVTALGGVAWVSVVRPTGPRPHWSTPPSSRAPSLPVQSWNQDTCHGNMAGIQTRKTDTIRGPLRGLRSYAAYLRGRQRNECPHCRRNGTSRGPATGGLRQMETHRPSCAEPLGTSREFISEPGLVTIVTKTPNPLVQVP